MFWLLVGFVLTTFGLSMLSHFSDWPGAERDLYFRNAAAAMGFVAFIGLLCILYGAFLGSSWAYPTLVLSLLCGAIAGWILRLRRQRKTRSLVATDDSKTIEPQEVRSKPVR